MNINAVVMTIANLSLMIITNGTGDHGYSQAALKEVTIVVMIQWSVKTKYDDTVHILT
jgi:hypothetical protein